MRTNLGTVIFKPTPLLCIALCADAGLLNAIQRSLVKNYPLHSLRCSTILLNKRSKMTLMLLSARMHSIYSARRTKNKTFKVFTEQPKTIEFYGRPDTWIFLLALRNALGGETQQTFQKKMNQRHYPSVRTNIDISKRTDNPRWTEINRPHVSRMFSVCPIADAHRLQCRWTNWRMWPIAMTIYNSMGFMRMCHYRLSFC